MCKKLLIISIFLLALAFSSTYAGRSSGRSGGYGPQRRTYYGQQQQYPIQQPPSTNPPMLQTPKEYLDSRSGFSTFGIISVIFAVIVFCLAFYYGIMCYPFLCRDEKKYRFMDVSSTITGATSRSIQSIENFPVDQKHQEV